MSKYTVSVSVPVYVHLQYEIESDSEEEACSKAERSAASEAFTLYSEEHEHPDGSEAEVFDVELSEEVA